MHQGGTVNAIGEFFFFWELRVEGPDKRHAIWGDEVESAHGFAKSWVMAGKSGDVGIGGFNGVGFVCEGCFLKNPSDDLLVIRGSDGEMDDGDEFQTLRFKH